MFSGGLKLDSWKDLNKVSDAEKRHRDDSKVQREDTKLDTRLREAFHSYKKPKPEMAKEPTGTKIASDLSKEGIRPETRDQSPGASGQSLGHHVKTTTAPSPSTQPPQIYKTPVAPSSNRAGVTPPHVREASHFVVPSTKQPQLADLLKSLPPLPPPLKGEDKKLPVKEGGEVKREVLELSAGKVKGPVASDAGAKLADATMKNQDDKGDVDKKKEGKKSEGREKTKGGKSTLASSRAEGSQGEQKLEASAGGVAGGNDEPLWIADLEPGVEIFNAETKLDESHALVLRESKLFTRHVLKNHEASAVLQNALALNNNEELNEALKEGLAARTHNIYGMTRG